MRRWGERDWRPSQSSVCTSPLLGPSLLLPPSGLRWLPGLPLCELQFCSLPAFVFPHPENGCVPPCPLSVAQSPLPHLFHLSLPALRMSSCWAAEGQLVQLPRLSHPTGCSGPEYESGCPLGSALLQGQTCSSDLWPTLLS